MDLSKHLDKAKEAISRRNYKLAAQICSQLLSIQPDDGEARATLRQALFKKAEAKAPSRIAAMAGGGVHLLVASISRLVKKHASAARAAERYLALDPLHERVNLMLGDSLERAGFKKSALAVYRSYADAHPRCLPACRQAGALLYEAGDVDAAMEMYERAIKVDPRDQESLKARKNLAAEGALRSTGIERAKSSRELVKDPQELRRLDREGRLQLSKEEIAEELAEIEEKLAALGFGAQGQGGGSSGEGDGAVGAGRAGVTGGVGGRGAADAAALLARAADLRGMENDLQGGIDYLERAVALAPERSDLADRAGAMRLRLQEDRVRDAERRGDTGAAARAQGVLDEMRIVEFRRRVQAHPTDFGARCDLGQALLAAGEIDAAIGELQQAVKDARRKGEARVLLGRAFRAKGLHDLAMKQLEAALAEVGDFGRPAREILYEMGCVAEDAGKASEALGFFSRVLEQDIGYRDVAAKVEQLRSSAAAPHPGSSSD